MTSESLSPAERAGESVYLLMRRGALSQADYVRRMEALENISPVAACYVTWLLLRDVKPSVERDKHWRAMVAELRAALRRGG